jgi:hypothetical protein
MFVDSERKDVFGFRKKRMFWQNVSAMFLDSERKDVFGFSRVSWPEWGLVNWDWSFTPWSPLLQDGEGLDEWIRALTPLAPVLRNNLWRVKVSLGSGVPTVTRRMNSVFGPAQELVEDAGTLTFNRVPPKKWVPSRILWVSYKCIQTCSTERNS